MLEEQENYEGTYDPTLIKPMYPDMGMLRPIEYPEESEEPAILISDGGQFPGYPTFEMQSQGGSNTGQEEPYPIFMAEGAGGYDITYNKDMEGQPHEVHWPMYAPSITGNPGGEPKPEILIAEELPYPIYPPYPQEDGTNHQYAPVNMPVSMTSSGSGGGTLGGDGPHYSGMVQPIMAMPLQDYTKGEEQTLPEIAHFLPEEGYQNLREPIYMANINDMSGQTVSDL